MSGSVVKIDIEKSPELILPAYNAHYDKWRIGTIYYYFN